MYKHPTRHKHESMSTHRAFAPCSVGLWGAIGQLEADSGASSGQFIRYVGESGRGRSVGDQWSKRQLLVCHWSIQQVVSVGISWYRWSIWDSLLLHSSRTVRLRGVRCSWLVARFPHGTCTCTFCCFCLFVVWVVKSPRERYLRGYRASAVGILRFRE